MYSSVKLEEALTQNTDYIDAPEPRSYRKLSVKLYGKGVVLDEPVDGATLLMKRHQLAKAGQVILSEIWGKKGALGFVPLEGEGALCTSHFFLFDVRTDRLLSRYLHYIFISNYLEPQLNKEAKGTTGYAAVRPKHLLAAEIPLPPLDEQRRIVAHLDALAEQIAAARGLRQSAVEEAEVFLGAAIVEIFTDLSVTYPDTVLGDFATDVRYGTSRKTDDDESGTPIFRMGNIQNGKLLFDGFKYLLLDDHETDTILLEPGDILVNRTNSAELVGKCAVFSGEGQYSFASYIIRVRLDEERALPTLTAYYINSPSGRAYMFRERKQMTGQANVNSKTLNALPLPLPPMDDQRRIVAYLDALQAEVERLKRLQAETAAELDALLPSLLDRAFRGKL